MRLHRHTRLAFVILLVVGSVAIGYVCGRLEAGLRDSIMQVFTVLPPLAEWARQLLRDA